MTRCLFVSCQSASNTSFSLCHPPSSHCFFTLLQTHPLKTAKPRRRMAKLLRPKTITPRQERTQLPDNTKPQNTITLNTKNNYTTALNIKTPLHSIAETTRQNPSTPIYCSVLEVYYSIREYSKLELKRRCTITD